MSKWCIFSLSTVSLTSTGCSSGFQPFKICLKVFKFEDVSSVFSKLFILTDSSAIGCRLNCSRNFFAVFRKFCIFFQLDSKCLWAFDSKVVRYQILAAKVQAVYILELCLTKDLMLNYVLQVVHFLLLFLSACISLDSGQPTVSYCFCYQKVHVIVLVTGCKLQHQVFFLLFFIQIDPMKSSWPNI